jgi:hypothetical protein
MHEIAAGGGALAVPRALWGFGRGLRVERVGVERKNRLVLLKPSLRMRG